MSKAANDKKVNYRLNPDGEFIIENYNYAKPLANFFPGIAGKYGIPMWVFYVNRGQCINSFGTDGKDQAILEFQPANKAWQQTSLLGFRTFIKITSDKKESFYEPFHNGFTSMEYDLENQMAITSYDLKIKELNKSLGLEINVEYFTIPQDSYAALVRIVRIRNTSRKPRKLQLLDGLPRIVPFGIGNFFLKKLCRTIEAWMQVENLKNGVPFYKVDVDPIDRPQVLHIKGGNFYMTFQSNGKKNQVIKPVVDPEAIFGQINDFSCPRRFISTKKFAYPAKQQTVCKTPCGFALLDLDLASGEEKTFYSVIGNTRNIELLDSAVKKILKPGYLEQKKAENKDIIDQLQSEVDTKSSSAEFNQYCRQTYLDNIMRGGYPVTFAANDKEKVFYLYSRKHGDLERDYNKFQIQDTYFSQGNGNYRDMNQNRRCDVWFHPEIKEFNIPTFFNLLQADGFNPLVVKGASFRLQDSRSFQVKLNAICAENEAVKIIELLRKPFNPGEVILFLEENKIKLTLGNDEFLALLLTSSDKIPQAEHGEGFWIDHWHYNLDLLENYLGVYPEKLKELVFDKKCVTFFDNEHVIRPRGEKYLLLDGQPKQLHSVVFDREKKELIGQRRELPHVMRCANGKGDVYVTTLANKLFCLLVNKLSSLDPFGVGIEMEADKPNWFDALNGLPALFGSSTCETFELKRLVLFLRDAFERTKTEKIVLSEEVGEFLMELGKLLKEDPQDRSADKEYKFWDKCYDLRDAYRKKTKFGFSGKEVEFSFSEIKPVLEDALRKIDLGLAKAKAADSELYFGYFMNEVAAYDNLQDGFIKPTKFSQKKVPYFLEAQMHALRLTDNKETARNIYKATKQSPLYDKALKMYKVTAPLKDMPFELGRCRAFTPGWLENESVWLHMEYKYLLEILEQGLYEEFYADFRNVLIPFQKPERYGRSILENSSFLVSSAFPYKELHGNGFVARLSGSTVEFLNMWLVMNIGKKPFILDNKHELNLRFAPALAGWLFAKVTNTYGFLFLGKTQVTYHNPKAKNTFGKDAAVLTKIAFNDKNNKPVQIFSDTIPAPYALQIRDGLIKKIDIFLE
jgi:hypothetical protein